MFAKLKTNIPMHDINNALLLCIIVVNLYTITAPLVPTITFWWQKHHTQHSQQLSQLLQPPNHTSPTPLPTHNTLIVPSMILNTPIYEGPVSRMYKILDQGVWRWPAGSTPNKGGNTILIGHRFTYTNPSGTFYHLDKVKVGDQIGVFWSSTQYVYKVASVAVVPPTQVTILDQTAAPELTLYTCTPTWNPKNRLVIVATLISTRSFKAT